MLGGSGLNSNRRLALPRAASAFHPAPDVRIYLDVCCLSRRFDDPAQERVRNEAESLRHLLHRAATGAHTIVTSSVVAAEIARDHDEVRRAHLAAEMRCAGERVDLTTLDEGRARELVALGFGPFDALHLACAEAAGVDLLLTTDDRFLRRAQRYKAALRVRVYNPVDFDWGTAP
jgi:predicted nucleic acid-binding protein